MVYKTYCITLKEKNTSLIAGPTELFGVVSYNSFYWAIKITNKEHCLEQMKKMGLKDPEAWIEDAVTLTIDEYNTLNDEIEEQHLRE